MPIYQYEGVHYDLPDGLSNEDAIAKIEAHLGKTPSAAKPQQSTQTPAQLGIPDSTPMPYTPPPKSRWDDALAGESGLAQTAAGLLGAATTGPLAMATQAASSLWNKGELPNSKEAQNAFNEGSDVLPSMIRSISGPKGIQAGENMGSLMNEILPGAMHLHTMHVEGAGVMDPSTALAMRADKATPKVVPKATGNPILDALDAAHTKEPVVAPTGGPLVDTRPSLDKSKLAYEQALREQELARQSAFNRPEQIGNLPQEDAMSRMARDLGAEPNKIEAPVDTTTPMGNMSDQLTKDVGNNKTMTAQDVIDARNKEHDTIAQNLEAARQDMENRKQASNMDSTPSAEAQAHMDHVAAEEQHRTHLEETHARAMDEQAKLEEAQKAIDDSMSGVKSQHEGIRQLTAEGGPKTERLAAEAELRRRQEEAPTKSKKQVAIEAKTALEAERTRLIEQRAANEEMIQKLRDQHTESDIRTKQAQADAQEAIAKRNEANTAETTKAAQAAAKLRAEAEALAKDKAKRDKALANIAKQHALQEITHPAGSKERAAAVKAVNARFSGKTGGAAKKSVSRSKQGGAIDPQVFKEGYRKLTAALSKLTDQPWLKNRFSKDKWMTNSDGTPLVMLHGTTKDIKGEIGGKSEGFHAGFTTSPHMFITNSARGSVPLRDQPFARVSGGYNTLPKEIHRPENTKVNAQIHPVAIKKGNYPFIPEDMGGWNPRSLMNDRRFIDILNKALGDKGFSPENIKSMRNYVENAIGDDARNAALTNVLKKADIDGFFYKNSAESIRSEMMGRGKGRADTYQHPTSFVTWNPDNFQSIYKPTEGEVHPMVGDDVNTAKAKEAGLFGADENGITELHGGLPLPKAMRDKLDGAMKALTDAAASIGRKSFDPNTASRDYITNSFTSAKQAEDAIGKVVAPSDVIARATAPGSTDIPLNPEATSKVPFTNRSIKYGGISESVQSGLNMAALKFKEEPVIRGVQNFLNNGLARTNYQISQMVVPLTKMLNRLSPEEMVTHDGVLQREQKMGKSFTDDQLRAAGMNDKQLAAYKMQRKAYDSAYTLQNEQLKKMGEKPLSRDDYYYSSRWSGDYHTIITKDHKDASGKVVMDPETNKPKQDVVWFVRTTSRAENLKAIEHLKENFPELNIDKDTKPKYMGNNHNPNAPHDVAGAYRDMMGFFKDAPETTAAIKEAMESYTTAKGYSNLGQSKHFEHKAGVRGFAGDTPWLTAEESAKAGTKAQVDYLKNAIRWANLQETVANAKKVLSDPKVMEMKPNAVSLAQHIINRELGLDTNIVAPIENGIAEVFGVSRNSVLRFVGDIKGMTYLQTLGLNPMYSLATPLQFMVTGPMMHMVMSSEGGYKTGVRGALKTMAFGMTDATAGIMAHMAHEMGSDTVEGFVSKAGMTDIGKQALKYMEDSGYIKRNIFDESRSVGQHTPMDKVQAGLGWTIGKPEQIARMMSFMSFVHHLDASGAFHGDVKAMFHEAEIYSDRALSSFKSFDRPMMVDKLGALGQAGYVYQSFKFQSYHTLNAAFRMLGRGDPKPIAALMIAYGLGTGMMNVPGMQELDGLVNFGKDMISKFKPDLYTPAVRDFDLRDKLLSNLPTTKVFRQMSVKSIATNGLAGEATGLAIAPHISPQILDTEHLGNNFPGAVMAQEAKEWGSIGKMAIHPNTSSLTEAAYKNLPGAKGPMEEYLPNIKQGNTPGHQVFINPNDMNNPKTMPYARNQEDEAKRKWNAVSTNEGNLKQNWYRSGQEDMRIKNALQGNIEGLLGAYHRGDTKQMADYTMAYMKLDPESTRIDETINNGIPRQYMSKADQQVADAKKLLVMQSIMRNRNMPK